MLGDIIDVEPESGVGIERKQELSSDGEKISFLKSEAF